jgi:hypothetical protein
MLVSHFELLVKRIAPLSSASTGSGTVVPTDAPFRRIVQGYFLTITNLQSTTINLRMRATIPKGFSLPSFDREIQVTAPVNARTGFDVASQNNVTLAFTQIAPKTFAKRFQTSVFTIRPHETVSVNLLPNVGVILNPSTPGASPFDPQFEVRGFVELFQSVSIGGSVPPARVLVTAEYRGSVLDNDYPTSNVFNELDFDQVSYSVPLASGKAENTIPGIHGLIKVFEVLPDDLKVKVASVLEGDLATKLTNELAELELEDFLIDPVDA